MPHALIVVDVQIDFCEGGALAVEGGNAVAARVAELLAGDHGYDSVVATRDWHVDPGWHFAAEPDFRDSWPAHCVADAPGAQLHPTLQGITFDAVFDKGQYDPGYSGFDGAETRGRPLSAHLRALRVDAVDIVGIATDHCVRATALDAAGLGFAVRVRLDLTAGVAPESTGRALDQLRDAGVEITGKG